jgi:protein-histidine pros-kinase
MKEMTMSQAQAGNPFPSGQALWVLIVEDDAADAELAMGVLKRAGYPLAFDVIDSAADFEDRLAHSDYDAILCDHNLGTWTGMEALEILKKSGKDIPFLVLTGALGDEAAVEYVKRGASDYLLKDRLERLPTAVQRVLEEKRLRTENKRAFEAISRLATIVESSDDAIIGTTLEGVITSWNKGAEKLYGYSAAEALGQLVSVLVLPDRSEEVTQILARLKRGESIEHHETVRVRKDGSLVDVSLSIFPLTDSRGEVTGLASIARDITKRKCAERVLQEKNLELENATLAKDRFLASMSHELRTPLNAILGFAGMLLMKLAGPLNPDQEKQLRTVQSSGKYLLSLINDLLDLAKIESGKVELHLQPVVCQNILAEVAAQLAPLAESKGLQLEVSEPETEVVVRTDRRALTQVVLNLANNAIKFTDKGYVRLDLQRRGEKQSFVEFSVADSGMGIRPEDQARLFEAFVRVEDPAARHREGTGLGLHLSRKLAGLLGARIRLESQYGTGSKFTVSMPE